MMRMVFLDESGYTPDWRTGIEQQPLYVLSAVLLPAEQLAPAYADLREKIRALGIPGQTAPLGQGFEIKAKDVAGGSPWWRDHETERNAVRDTMLGWPGRFGGTAFVVVIDKERHRGQYAFPDNPYMLALQFILERVATYLKTADDYGYCVYDHNKRIEADIQNYATELIRDGSFVTVATLSLDRIHEMTLGSSANSIGLQAADYFASLTYAYFRRGKPSPCGWWDQLRNGLHTVAGVLEGIGLNFREPSLDHRRA